MNEYQKNHLATITETTIRGIGDSDRHALTLFGIAAGSKGKLFLELGVRNGDSTLPLLLAAHLVGAKLISVDIQQTTFTPPPDLAPHWQFIQSDALAYLSNVPNDTVFDIVFVDDWHTYPHVKKELELLTRHVTPQSIVCLHDLMYGGTEPRYHTNPGMHKGEWAYGGPYRAVANLNDSWEWATLPWHSGLTILRKKDSVFAESRIKMWAKRTIRHLVPNLWQRLLATYRHFKTIS